MAKKTVNWQKTGKRLKLLRCDNVDLRRYVCRQLSLALKMRHVCPANNCDDCTLDMDNQISAAELAEVFGVSDSVVNNWETGRSIPTVEDLLFYCEICRLPLESLLVFD